jgi:hypothetical protein
VLLKFALAARLWLKNENASIDPVVVSVDCFLAISRE